MSRLTEKVDNVKLLETDIRYLPKGSSMRAFDVLNKLGELEDLEEQGRLIEVKHGRWIYKDNFIGKYLMCSECSHVTGRKSNYCPHCGAKMDEVEK